MIKEKRSIAVVYDQKFRLWCNREKKNFMLNLIAFKIDSDIMLDD